jgi:hypothetical protein
MEKINYKIKYNIFETTISQQSLPDLIYERITEEKSSLLNLLLIGK